MVIATACWASTMIANKSIINLLAVTEINSMRFLIGAVTMFLVAGAAGQLARIRNVGVGPILMGLLEPGGSSLFLVWGLAHTSAVSASVILSTIPILMPVLGWAVLREPMRASVLIGAAVAVVGTILLVQGQNAHAGGNTIGDLIVLIGVLFICTNQLVARRVAQVHGSAAAVSALQLSAAALLSLAVLITIEHPDVYLAHFDSQIASTILFIGLMGGAIPFLLHNFSLRYMSVGRVSLFVPLIGPLGAIMAWAYLDTLITGVDVLAIAMVVFGVAVPTLSKNSTPKSR